MTSPREQDIQLARAWAAIYRARGYNCLPSRMDAKRPLIRFRQFWNDPVPEGLFEQFATTNLQIVTGLRWQLMVIDLDGDEARQRWPKLGPAPRTWTVVTGDSGLQLWFSLTGDTVSGQMRATRGLPTGFLWKGAGSHSAIERKCDRGLVVAPPSIHPQTGRQYRWYDQYHSPLRMMQPAPCPGWLLRMPLVHETDRDSNPSLGHGQPRGELRPHRQPGPLPRSGENRFRLDDVKNAIPDKIGVARDWGVRFTGHKRPDGWYECHALDRKDAHPSAAIHAETGIYVDQGSGLTLPYFCIPVHLGLYSDWREAVTELGRQYVHR